MLLLLLLFSGFSGTRAPGSPGEDPDVGDGIISLLAIFGIVAGFLVGGLLVMAVVVFVCMFLRDECNRRARHYACTARSARHPSPSAPRQELAAALNPASENGYTRPPPINPSFVEVNEV